MSVTICRGRRMDIGAPLESALYFVNARQRFPGRAAPGMNHGFPGELPSIHSPAGGGCMFRVFPAGSGLVLLAAGVLTAGIALAQTAGTAQTTQTAARSNEAMKDT